MDFSLKAESTESETTLINHYNSEENTTQNTPPGPTAVRRLFQSLAFEVGNLEELKSPESARLLKFLSDRIQLRQELIKLNPAWRRHPTARSQYRAQRLIINQIRELRFSKPIMELIRGRLTNPNDVIAIIPQIYRDIDNYARSGTKEQEDVRDKAYLILEEIHKSHDVRYQAVKRRLDNALSAYLFISKEFLRATVELNDQWFDMFLTILKDDAASFMIFARVRLPLIAKLDTKLSAQFLCFLGISRKADVHWYVVPPRAQTMTITPTFVETVADNVFDVEDFRGYDAPTGWSDTVPWPSHPGARHAGTTCYMCQDTTICDCQPSRAESGEYLLEIYNYGIRGRGVRILQKIDKDEIIGEYVGHFKPIGAIGEVAEAWRIGWTNPHPDEQFNRNIPIAILDSGNEGNWTRFINSHCTAPNVKLRFYNIGKYRRVMVQALREIEVYEELLITYSKDHWETLTCHCGSSDCVSLAAHQAAEKAKPATNADSSSNDKSTPAPSDHPRQASYLMSTSIHPDITDSEPESSVVPRTAKKATTKKRAAAKEAEDDADWEDEDDDKDLATKRRTEERAARRERLAWRKRWIGQENAERPRSKGAKSGAGPYFAEF